MAHRSRDNVTTTNTKLLKILNENLWKSNSATVENPNEL